MVVNYYFKVLERRGLLRGIRARRPRPAIRGNGLELQSVVLRIRAFGSGWRHGLSGGSGVQPDLVQHAAGHSPKCGPDHIPVRFQEPIVPRDSALPHHTEHERFGGAGSGFRVPPPEPRRGVHCRGHVHRRSPPAVELAGCGGSSAPPAYTS